MNEYNLFLPPEHLAEKGRLKWSSKEADEYYNWLMSVKDPRVNKLLSTINYSISGNICNDLDVIESKVIMLLNTTPYSKRNNSKYELTNYGLAIAADVGLLLANTLTKNNTKVKWQVIKKNKSDSYFNLPVLFGFGKLYFDPVGGTISDLKERVNNPNLKSSLCEAYLFWDEKAKKQV